MDASSFNQPLNNWNVSKVREMNCMFWNAESFNQPLNKWNVSNVTNMDAMFFGTFLRGRKGRAAKNSVLTSGVKQLKC